MSLKPPIDPTTTFNTLTSVASSEATDAANIASLTTRVTATEKKTQYAVITNPIGAYSGAVGDGTTDNTAVIQAWIDWVEANLATTRVVYVPAGNFVASGLTLTTASLVGEDPTRSLLGTVTFGSRLIHKSGATTPLITMAGGASSNLGWERVENLALQGRQKANISVTKRAIVSASDRTHFTVALADLPTAPADFSNFPHYGLCLFFDANGQRLGSGIVNFVNTGTGVVTLRSGTDNYTGITGSGNLLTSTEKVAFAPIATYTIQGNTPVTLTNVTDETMIGPPAIFTTGKTKRIEWVDIRDFHCSIVQQEGILALNHFWSHNHAMAAYAQRYLGGGSDVYGDHWDFQGRGYEGYGESSRAIGVIDAQGMYSLCGLWGVPNCAHVGSVVAESHMHAIIDKGGEGGSIDYLLIDGTWKEGIVTWSGIWQSGTANPTHKVGFLQARTLQPQYALLTAPTYPSGEKAVIGIAATDSHRKWRVETLVANRFDSTVLDTFKWASVAKLATPTNGFHEVIIGSLPYQEAVTTKGSARGQSLLPGAYCTMSGSALQRNATAAASNQGRVTRFEVDRDMVVTSIAFAVTAVTIGDTADPAVDVAIYSAAGARLVSAGATSGKLNTTGRKTVTITATTLRAGSVYYLGLSTGALGTTTVSLMGVSPVALQASQLFGTTIGLVETDAANTAHPLPATWTISAVSSIGWLGAVLE